MKFDPIVMGKTSFFEPNNKALGLAMLFVVVVNLLEVGTNVDHLFFYS
jgi:hypothetical protein